LPEATMQLPHTRRFRSRFLQLGNTTALQRDCGRQTRTPDKERPTVADLKKPNPSSKRCAGASREMLAPGHGDWEWEGRDLKSCQRLLTTEDGFSRERRRGSRRWVLSRAARPRHGRAWCMCAARSRDLQNTERRLATGYCKDAKGEGAPNLRTRIPPGQGRLPGDGQRPPRSSSTPGRNVMTTFTAPPPA